MKSIGIVAEYNPFHKGHLYQIEKTIEMVREICDEKPVVTVVMSGNFTQRGEAAIFDKWTRAEMAVLAGADLVVELPTVYATGSAGYFAAAGIDILENLGVDYISFGSESGDLSELKYVLQMMKEKEMEIEGAIKEAVKEGISYPRARQRALEAFLNEEELQSISNPNNILAIEYLKNIKKAQPLTVKRQGAGYNDMDAKEGLASATLIRALLKKGEEVEDWIPEKSIEAISAIDTKPCDMEDFFKMLVTKVMTLPAEEIEKAEGGGEGLGNKLKNIIRSCNSWEEIVEKLKSKRYTRTRIMRFLAHVLLGITEEDIKGGNTYVRVLAFSKQGAKYLKQVKKSDACNIPIITNINKDVFPEIEDTLAIDILATDLYNLAMGRDMYKYSDYVQTVRMI